MTCRGVRGAISVQDDSEEAIIAATRRLLEQIVAANDIRAEDVAGVFFTATPDLSATYPARAARQMGWNHVPLLCSQEMVVIDGLPRCVRVLVLWNTECAPEHIQHIYLDDARVLRPDLTTRHFDPSTGSFGI